MLQEMIREKHSTHSLDEKLSLICEQTMGLMDVDAVVIGVKDTAAAPLTIRAVAGRVPNRLIGRIIPTGVGLTDLVLSTGCGQISEYCLCDGRFAHGVEAWIKQLGLMAAMAVPMPQSPEPQGILFVFKRDFFRFNRWELGILGMIGNMTIDEIVRQRAATETPALKIRLQDVG